LHLKGVVLWGHLDLEVVSQDRHLLHDVLAHTRYLGKEEEGEEAGYATEAGGETTAGGVLGECSAVLAAGGGTYYL